MSKPPKKVVFRGMMEERSVGRGGKSGIRGFDESCGVLKREKVAFAVCRIARRTLTAPLLFIQKPVDILLVLDGVVVKRRCEEQGQGGWVG